MMRAAPTAAESEDGQANLFLLVGLTLSLIAVMLLFVRLGNANALRSDAQSAADAAALAAAGIARDNAAEALANDEIPYSRLYEPARGRSAAEHYAQENGAVLKDIRASDDSQGNLGNIVRVEVSTEACQNELEQDGGRDWTDVGCDSESEPDSSHIGNAAAIAEVVVPECDYMIGDIDIIGLTCEGEPVQSFSHAQQLIDVRLTDSEGRYIYNPLDSNPDFAASSQETTT
ncbi:hypothetical protein FZ103_15345 [Streptomonospora sp. PA3]|uniref:pilus assembly protein TadG-related protein n=1 Tax=Streptomonospora sp. PA3 TaxID=2607326 RepID=UPI0012DE1873|nr:pilus assembly protein TadG-related protein [Streptomonospora sp. PA3]MUL42530.1 hypothetical protein [Streptomonospora sp. PA3]